MSENIGHGANEDAIAHFLAGVALSIQVGVAGPNPRTLWAIKMKDEEKIYLLLEDGTEVCPVDLIDRNRPVDEEVVLVEPNPGLVYRLLPRYDNMEAARLLPHVEGDLVSVLGGLARDLDAPNDGACISRLHGN